MSKEFWIAICIVSICIMISFLTKMLIMSDLRDELRSINRYPEKKCSSPVTTDLSTEKRIIILETKMAVLLEERAEQAKK